MNEGTAAQVWRRGRGPTILAALVGLCGLADIFQALLPKEPDVLLWMEQFLPFAVSQRSRALLLGGGLFLLVLSRGLYRRKHAAYLLTLVLLLGSPLLHLGSAFDWEHALVQVVLAAALIRWRGEFQALSDGPSVRRAAVIAVMLVTGLMAFGLASFRAFSTQIEGDRSLGREMQAVLELVFLQSTDTFEPAGPQARTVFRTISEAGIVFGLVALVLFLRPILPHRSGHGREPARAREIIKASGRDPLDEFALFPDKRHFLAPDGLSLVSYAIWRDVAVTLGDPIGPAENAPAAIMAFTAFCTRQDWHPVLYEVRADHLDAYRAAGFRLFKIAEDARIPLEGFTLAGRKFQNLRTAQNKAAKSGWTVEWLPGAALQGSAHDELATISADWLAARHAIEMTFDLGSFNRESLEPAEVAILRDGEQRALAFATWLPYAQGAGRALDMIRHRPADRGVVDPLMVGCLLDLQKHGVAEVSLGNAPLANVEPGSLDSLEEKAVRLLYQNFDRYYGYRTLFAFKDKFHPLWSGRYLAYLGVGNLGAAVAGVVRVHLPSGLTKFLRS